MKVKVKSRAHLVSCKCECQSSSCSIKCRTNLCKDLRQLMPAVRRKSADSQIASVDVFGSCLYVAWEHCREPIGSGWKDDLQNHNLPLVSVVYHTRAYLHQLVETLAYGDMYQSVVICDRHKNKACISPQTRAAAGSLYPVNDALMTDAEILAKYLKSSSITRILQSYLIGVKMHANISVGLMMWRTDDLGVLDLCNHSLPILKRPDRWHHSKVFSTNTYLPRLQPWSKRFSARSNV